MSRPDYLLTAEGALEYGTPAHAAAVTECRHQNIRDGLQWLTYSHLPPALRRFSSPFYYAAVSLIQTISTDSPELVLAIDRLIEAKDSAVRAGIRHDTGRAGSVSRPQEVVSPPAFVPVQPLFGPGSRKDTWSPAAE